MTRTKVIALALALLAAAPAAATTLIDDSGRVPATLLAGAPATTSTSTAGQAPAGTVVSAFDDRAIAAPSALLTDEVVASGAPAAPDGTTSSSTTRPPSVVADPTPARPADGVPAVDDQPVSPAGETHDVVPGAGGPPPAEPADPIGGFDDDGPVPAGLDLVAPPKKPKATNGLGGPGGLAVAPSCAVQCITRGVAYPRGFGAELIVETSVPAELYMTVVADLDHNGDYEDLHVETTPAGVTEHSWTLDHLEPGETYYGMVAATDANGHTAYAWGEFTTLSTRRVFVELGAGEIVGGPGSITSTQWQLGLTGTLMDVTPGQQGILLFPDLPRHIDVDFWITRGWDDELCETWYPTETSPPHGHESGACVAWNSASIDGIDLDQAPAGRSHWTQTSVSVPLRPAAGTGDALPPGYGDPYWFAFDIPMTLHVSYTT